MMVLLGLSLYLPLFLQGVLAISPTVAGLAITPLSLSMVLEAMLAGPIIGARKRYQLVIVFGALLMGTGSFLLTLMTPETGLLQTIVSMIVVGTGLGSFFSLSVIAQNMMPASRLGVSTATTRYLGQLGATLGIAIVGTVVSSGISGTLLLAHLAMPPQSNMARRRRRPRAISTAWGRCCTSCSRGTIQPRRRSASRRCACMARRDWPSWKR
jgi:hypothetical protein